VNKQPSKSDRLPLIDELSLITKANNDGGATAAAVAGSAATTTNARYTANISAGSSWTSLSKCSGDRASPLLGRYIVHSDDLLEKKPVFTFIQY
jgi:hypothetical protein